MHKPVLDHLHTAVVLIDADLNVSYVNPAAEALLDASAKHLIGTPLPVDFSVSDEQSLSFAELLEQGQQVTCREASLSFLGGRSVTVDYTVTPVLLDKRASLLIEMQQLDRMLRISREENLLQSQQAARELARGVAHEIKNPLGGIRGAAQLLARKLNDDEALEYTQVVIDEADRLTRLADQLLGPRTPPRYEEINIHEVFEHVRSLVKAEYNDIQFIRDYDISIPEIEVDRAQLVQVILNITRNAVQALTENNVEAPSITLRSRVLRQFTIGSNRYKLVLCAEIIDNGPGIPKEMQESIFYPLISGRAEGTGLGLAIAQSIIRQLSGLIECESAPGRTKFTLLIPMIERSL